MAETPQSGLVGDLLRVLVIDDEETVRDLVCRMLETPAMLPVAADSGRDGLYRLLQAPFDIVVVDLRMSRMDGFAFITEALKIRPWLGVVILSGHVDDAARARAQNLGVAEILTKPFQKDALIAAIRRQADARRGARDSQVAATLEKLQIESDFLRNLSQSAVDSANPREDWKKLCAHLSRMYPSDAVGIFTDDPGDPVLYLYTGNATRALLAWLQGEILRHYDSLQGRKPLVPPRVVLEGEAQAESGPAQAASVCMVPIIQGDTILGSLTLASHRDNAYTKSDTVFIYHAANQLAAMAAMFRRIRELAVRDSLTGLYNRGHFHEQLAYIKSVSQRHGMELTVGALDVDHFKEINDLHGHPAGDQVLAELAALLRGVLRASDLLGRMGGDEFALALPGASPTEAREFAARLLAAVRGHTFLPGTLNLRVTVSLGLATVPIQALAATPADALMQRADLALYRAKELGRNRAGFLAHGGEIEVDLTDHTRPSGSLHGVRAEGPPLTRDALIEFMTSLLGARMDSIGGHSLRTRDIALLLCRDLGLAEDETREIADGALLHDLGKFTIPDAILRKTSALTKEEWAVLQRHPEIGFRMLSPFTALRKLAEIVHAHHERLDGKGYPRGLRGEAIYFGARLVAVADAYDALRADRSYHEVRPPEEAAGLIQTGAGSRYDPRVVESFFRCRDAIEAVLRARLDPAGSSPAPSAQEPPP